MKITGNTRVFGIVADPIAQVRTPEVLNAYFTAHGIDAVMVPLHVPAAGLAQAWQGMRAMRNLGGWIVTVPHKNAVASLCDALGPAASVIGAVNAVRRLDDGRLVGDMFDGAGFVGGLRGQGHDPAGRSVLLVGAGGAAAAIAHALAQAGVGRLGIANRTLARADEIAQRVRQAFPDADVQACDADPRGYDMVVNATSLGMRPDDALPLDVNLLDARTLVAEIIMKPAETPLLQVAKQRGCPIHAGRHMLDAQAALMARFLLGEPGSV